MNGIYGDYLKFLKKFARLEAPLKIICDASNGSAGPILKKLKIKNLKVVVLNSKPDGNFPAHGPDPSGERASRELSLAVKKQKADFGAIFDGDADRVFFVDGTGRRINPDAIALLVSRSFRPPFVITPTCGWTFRKALPAKKFKLSPVGHFFIKKVMENSGAGFGAETSGHYYFEYKFGKKYAYFDSSLRALLEFSSAVSKLKKDGSTLFFWLSALPDYAVLGELNFKTNDPIKKLAKLKKKLAKLGKISALDGVSVETEDFWFNLRPSNTEPFLRLNAEAKDKKTLRDVLKKLNRILKV